MLPTTRNALVLSALFAVAVVLFKAEQILAEIGVEFRGDDAALDLWRKAGAKVDGMRVRFDGARAHVYPSSPVTVVP